MELGIIGWLFVISIAVYIAYVFVIIGKAGKNGKKPDRKTELIFAIFTLTELILFLIYKVG